MKREVEKFVERYVWAEQRLIKALLELRNGGEECDCDERSVIETVYTDEPPEVVMRCLNCGGYVEP